MSDDLTEKLRVAAGSDGPVDRTLLWDAAVEIELLREAMQENLVSREFRYDPDTCDWKDSLVMRPGVNTEGEAS